jgi:hypothetical protein
MQCMMRVDRQKLTTLVTQYGTSERCHEFTDVIVFENDVVGFNLVVRPDRYVEVAALFASVAEQLRALEPAPAEAPDPETLAADEVPGGDK